MVRRAHIFAQELAVVIEQQRDVVPELPGDAAAQIEPAVAGVVLVAGQGWHGKGRRGGLNGLVLVEVLVAVADSELRAHHPVVGFQAGVELPARRGDQRIELLLGEGRVCGPGAGLGVAVEAAAGPGGRERRAVDDPAAVVAEVVAEVERYLVGVDVRVGPRRAGGGVAVDVGLVVAVAVHQVGPQVALEVAGVDHRGIALDVGPAEVLREVGLVPGVGPARAQREVFVEVILEAKGGCLGVGIERRVAAQAVELELAEVGRAEQHPVETEGEEAGID